MPQVVIAYDLFPDLSVEEEVLRAIDATIIHTGNLHTARAIEQAIAADALIVSTEAVSSDLIRQMEKCRIISRAGTGIDAIDVDAATTQGILVTNVSDYAIDEVSTHAIALILAYVRRIPQLIDSTRAGQWDTHFVRPLPRLKGQTLGIFGFGRIGQATARKATGLGLRVIACDPYVEPSHFHTLDVEPVDLETLLQASDYLTLHAPLTESTRNVMNAGALRKMKPTAFLVNTARGNLVDEDALYEALKTGEIAGAAIDVLALEPPASSHKLIQMENCWVTPHIAWYSEAANHDVRVRAAEEVVRRWRGEAPRSPVNHIL